MKRMEINKLTQQKRNQENNIKIKDNIAKQAIEHIIYIKKNKW